MHATDAVVTEIICDHISLHAEIVRVRRLCLAPGDVYRSDVNAHGRTAIVEADGAADSGAALQANIDGGRLIRLDGDFQGSDRRFSGRRRWQRFIVIFVAGLGREVAAKRGYHVITAGWNIRNDETAIERGLHDTAREVGRVLWSAFLTFLSLIRAGRAPCGRGRSCLRSRRGR